MATCREATPPPGVRNHKPAGGGGDESELDVFAAERYFNVDDALWCAHSSSSLLSAFRTGTTAAHERGRSAATSSSEASWNSRSALLPPLPDEKVVGAAAASQSAVEAEDRGTEINQQKPRAKASPSPPPPPSLLRRWLLGVAGCGCVAGGDDGEESVSDADDLCHDEVGVGSVGGDGIGGNKKLVIDGVGQMLLQETESKKELAVGEEATSVRVRPGRWLDDGEELLTGRAALSPGQVQDQLPEDGHRRPVNSGDFSTTILNPATTIAALIHEQRRKCSSEMLRPLGDIGNTQLSTKQDDSPAFTIVAGKTAGGWTWSPATPATIPCEEDDAVAPSSEEDLIGCAAYPPSEASVVWSVVTAEGAASCANFSSAASGYYYHCHHFDGGGGQDGATRRSNDRRRRRRRSGGINNGGSGGFLLTCMGDRAVNVVGPVQRMAHGPEVGHDGWLPPDVMRRL